MDRRRKRKHKGPRKPAPYKAWVKVGPDKTLSYDHDKKVWSLVDWLDEHYPSWRFVNIYSKKTNELLAMYTKKNRPFWGEYP